MNERFEIFLSAVLKLVRTYLMLMLVFLAFRLAYMIRFGSEEVIIFYNDLPSAFMMGLRFDSAIFCYIAAIPLLVILFFSILKTSKSKVIINKFCRIFFIVTSILAVLILFIDQQYYTYFQSHINVLVFGFLEDDTKAVMTSIWTDHPVIRVLIILAVLVFLIFRYSKKIWYKEINIQRKFSIISQIFITLTVFFVFYVGIRGHITSFALSEEDAEVSESSFINLLPVNGVFALKTSISERMKAQKELTKEEILSKYSRNSVNEILSEYLDIPIDSINKNYIEYLYKTTPKNEFLETNKPNVVFILMESFGGYFLNFHSDELNLLGAMEEHIKTDYFYKNFLSSTRGTIYSLESILINSIGYPTISNTERRFVKQNSSVALPFKESGYETIFISCGAINWRNINELLPNLYFDKLIGNAALLDEFSEAEDMTWGVADEFMYKKIIKLLSEESDKPKLIVCLTTANHTPYEIPASYKPYPLNIHDSLYQKIIANREIADLVFRAYQYGCNSFGEFMNEIKSSSLAKNTIVAATGDHNSYTLFPYESTQSSELDKHAVPFYLYLPNEYQQNKVVDLSVAGSHKDIFPTIIEHALSNQKYFCAGNNLLSADSAIIFHGENLNYFHTTDTTLTDYITKKAAARRQLLEYYFGF